jgi:hypothetical protein
MINDEKENNEMENNVNDDYCYYSGDADYLIFSNDKEKRKKEYENRNSYVIIKDPIILDISNTDDNDEKILGKSFYFLLLNLK